MTTTSHAPRMQPPNRGPRLARALERVIYARPASRGRRRLSLLAALTITALFLSLAAPGGPAHAATFAPAQVVSGQGSTLTEDAVDPQIAGDGGYVVFDGIFDGVQGVWEKDVASGDLTLVAGQQSGALAAWNAPDAGSPSVSASGQYVAFTSAADLSVGESPDPDPDPTSGCSNVWLRNIDIPVGQDGAYTLVSALNGVATGIAYAGAGTSGCPGGGSASSDGAAISADGNEVAFTVNGASDLVTGSASDPTTPVEQVAVRYIASDTTVLVSQTMASEQFGGAPVAVPGGAALTSNGAAITESSDLPPGASAMPVSASTAAISADGSTVAWMGIDIPEQAPASDIPVPGSGLQGGDTPQTGFPAYEYDEPLWRDIASGPDSPTRRVTGGDDPSAPGSQGPLATDYDPAASNIPEGTDDKGPLYGTYVAPDGFSPGQPSLDQVTPALSANGQEVAFLATVPLLADASFSGSGGSGAAPTIADAYVVNMAPGLTRDQALTQLTNQYLVAGGAAGVNGIAISADGTKVAFTTVETAFGLSWPTLVTPAVPEQSGQGAAQLYEVDLTAGTMSMITYGYDGNPADGTAASPSFTADGNTLAFASGATNLVYGVSTIEPESLTNVFTMTEETTPDVAGTQVIAPPPMAVVVIAGPAWVLSVSTRTTRSGELVLHASVPGRGKLTTRVDASALAGAKAKLVASGSRSMKKAGVGTLTLKPAKRYAAALRSRDGLAVDVRVTFTASKHRTLTKTLQLSLRDRVKVKKAKKKKTKKQTKKQKSQKTTIHERARVLR